MLAGSRAATWYPSSWKTAAAVLHISSCDFPGITTEAKLAEAGWPRWQPANRIAPSTMTANEDRLSGFETRLDDASGPEKPLKRLNQPLHRTNTALKRGVNEILLGLRPMLSCTLFSTK